MKLIVAVSKNWGIGKDNNLLFNIPTDMKFFRETTLNKAVVMGRKTLDSFPGKKPLKNRVNIVLTRDKDFQREGVIVCHTKEEALKIANTYDDVYIIGGEAIYNMFLDDCDTALITKVESFADADKFLKNLDEDEKWHLSGTSEPIEENGHTFRFLRYEKNEM